MLAGLERKQNAPTNPHALDQVEAVVCCCVSLFTREILLLYPTAFLWEIIISLVYDHHHLQPDTDPLSPSAIGTYSGPHLTAVTVRETLSEDYTVKCGVQYIESSLGKSRNQ